MQPIQLGLDGGETSQMIAEKIKQAQIEQHRQTARSLLPGLDAEAYELIAQGWFDEEENYAEEG